MSAHTATLIPPLEASIARRLGQAEVVVLAGGTSEEREVSLSSGMEILRALDTADGRGPARTRLVVIDPQGRWTWEGRALAPTEALGALGRVDVFFIALHGGSGEDGTLQGFLECVGATYTGSPVRASALCMDKRASRALAAEAGLRVAAGLCLGARDVLDDPAGALAAARAVGAGGWAVKPRCGGSCGPAT